MKGLRPAVVSLIASAGFSILLLAVFKSESITVQTMKLSDINYMSVALVAIGVFVLRRYKVDPIMVMIVTGIIGVFIYGVF